MLKYGKICYKYIFYHIYVFLHLPHTTPKSREKGEPVERKWADPKAFLKQVFSASMTNFFSDCHISKF